MYNDSGNPGNVESVLFAHREILRSGGNLDLFVFAVSKKVPRNIEAPIVSCLTERDSDSGAKAIPFLTMTHAGTPRSG